MLTVQQSLFDGYGSKPPGAFLGNGAFGTVWAHPDGETIIKRSTYDDGTLAWLYWSLHSGCKLPGMPEVYSLALLADAGYVVTMKRYSPLRDTSLSLFMGIGAKDPTGQYRNMWYWPDVREDIYTEAQTKFIKALNSAVIPAYNGEPSKALGAWYDGFDDMHQGNSMWDADKQELVITDPSAARIDRKHLWMLLPQPSNFALEMQ